MKRELNDKRLRRIIEKGSGVMVLIDSKAKILYATPSIVRLLKKTLDEISGINSIQFIHPDDVNRFLRRLARLVAVPGKALPLEMRIKSGSEWKWVSAIATNLLSDKEAGVIVLSFHDITEFKKAEIEKNEFISIASHELKTPVTSIKAYVQLLEKHFSEDPKEKHILSTVNQQLDRLTELVNDLLSVSRIEKGKFEIKKSRFDISAVVKEATEQIQKADKEHTINVHVPRTTLVFADKNKIIEVINNLLSNAIKYSPSGTEIKVNMKTHGEIVQLDVLDHGIGIAKENLPKIFNSFYQEGRTKKGGLGLGLYISSLIIKNHHGKIRVKSKEGEGSTFSVRFPKKG